MSMIPSMLDMISKNTHSLSVVQEISAELTNHHQHDLLFEKVLTPSDVGKLNRLVIPKQYAEKYFPLRTAGSSSSSGEALLSFEDDIGKIWKFRYSYWTSSQSYVLTKGWSRYIKDKGLTAGDIVSFHRLNERLFIAWRTREHGTGTVHRIKYANTDHYQSKTTAVFPAPQHNFPSHPTISSTPRRLRLFGVNMEFNDQSKSSNASTNVLTLNHGSSSHQFNLEECMIKNEFQPAW